MMYDLSARNFCCCFSGHRPSRLPWRYNENDIRCIELKVKISHAIEELIIKGFNVFVSGMAQGFDMYCAEEVLRLQELYPHISLKCVLPCRNQAEKWSLSEKRRHADIVSKSDSHVIISEEYTPSCMMQRNRYMVDNSTALICFYMELERGGTKSTLDYARKNDVSIIML